MVCVMKEATPFWVGSLNGTHVVYDPSLQLTESRWVLLFLVQKEAMVAYRRRHARSISKAHASKHPHYEKNIASYRSWRQAQTEEQVQTLYGSLRRKDEATVREIAGTQARHAAFLSQNHVDPMGTTEPTRR